MNDKDNRSVLDLFRLDGRRVVVTGGGRGIGRAMAQAMGEAGADVALVSRTREQLDAAVGSVPNSVAVPADVMTVDPVSLLDDCQDALGGAVDVVVHAAGFQHRQPIVDFPPEQWDRILSVHLTAPFRISQELGRRQLADGRPGSHVFIGSLNNFQSVVPDIPAYAAAKSGVGALVRAISKEWSGRGIRANGVAPGWVRTELTESLFSDREKADGILSRIPMGRLAEPAEMASVALFLASDASSYITGQMIVVDGGWTTS
ncbi:SDR family oxidoreductase [Brooklawnia cerclae]|uniref:NAD(P)-dependent dehydrogenase (Short-subunit alcohol dehydrogenase family) n=1 Tax=Brooklawnia cerclae TaxID=349934 RepID=A0ABX0SEX1_9ACTN|nr:SDR family oxidoreductase [Brooklawnia cerclae]NIH56930.1 NAD(P)-dependent dehydrogenase (short-subunit alcohol dehydrogenase family) [Brooklawnia cerclae]